MNEALQKVWSTFLQLVKSSSKVQTLMKGISNGTATYQSAQEYSSALSNLLVQSASQVFPNDSQSVLNALKDSNICQNYFHHVDQYVYDLQKASNQSNGLGMNAVKTATRSQIIDATVNSSDDYDADIERFTSKAEYASNARVDDIERTNAEFQSNAGYKITVSRYYDGVGLSGGRVCEWCLDKCGVDVPYDEAYEQGMFARHEGCGCVIEYNNNGEKTYQSQIGGLESWKTSKELENFETRIIQKRNEILPHIKNVTKDYFKESTPGIGTIQAEPTYYSKNNHDAEIKNSRWLLEKFGGNIQLITEPEVRRVADYEWDGAYWELKSPEGSGKRTISNQFNSALKQIESNPGGLILETKNLKMNLTKEELVKECASEMIKKRFTGDVIIKNNDKLIAILHDDYND